MSYKPSLQKYYQEEIVPKLMEEFNYKSIMQVPKLVKISLNQRLGLATQDKKVVDEAVKELTLIAGQKAVAVNAKRSVSNFKLREGMPIAAMTTLRNEKMYEFLERLVNVALPRVKDFRGINDKSFDGRGNYSFGIQEHIIFPEIEMDKIPRILGMDVTFVTTAKTDAEALALLKHFGMPFKNQRN
ncbi:MAG TPA: 50S ribosomal protein L5 [Bacteroidetes bacterium]|nr:50S ribosomal protein L5 [Bacteroidota bacterium]